MKPLEVAQVGLLHVGDQGFFVAPFLPGANHDGRAVRVVGAEVKAAMPTQFLEAHPDVGLDVFDQVAEMDVAIGIGERGGDQDLAMLLRGLGGGGFRSHDWRGG